jgi:hypothetical protein
MFRGTMLRLTVLRAWLQQPPGESMFSDLPRLFLTRNGEHDSPNEPISGLWNYVTHPRE